MADIDRCTSTSGIHQNPSVLFPKDGSHRLFRACVEFLTAEQVHFHVMDSALPWTLRLKVDFNGMNDFAQEKRSKIYFFSLFTCSLLQEGSFFI
jgi:hypothetical protein